MVAPWASKVASTSLFMSWTAVTGSLFGVEPGPGVARVAVDGGLQIDLSHPLEHADEESVDGDERAGVFGLDVTLAELRAEALEQADLLVGEPDLALGGGLLQAQQSVVLGGEAMALPDPALAARGDLDAAQGQLLGDPHRAVAGVGERMVEDRRLDLGRHPVGVRPAGAGQPIDQPLGPLGLEVPADLVELLPAVAHHPAGLADVAEVGGKLQQAQLAPCYLLVRGHVVLRSRLDVARNTILTSPGGGMATPARALWILVVQRPIRRGPTVR